MSNNIIPFAFKDSLMTSINADLEKRLGEVSELMALDVEKSLKEIMDLLSNASVSLKFLSSLCINDPCLNKCGVTSRKELLGSSQNDVLEAFDLLEIFRSEFA